MIQDFGEHLLKRLKEARDAIAAGVVAGALEHDKYKFHCGEIHGLDLAMDHLQAVLEKAEERDDA